MYDDIINLNFYVKCPHRYNFNFIMFCTLDIESLHLKFKLLHFLNSLILEIILNGIIHVS